MSAQEEEGGKFCIFVEQRFRELIIEIWDILFLNKTFTKRLSICYSMEPPGQHYC